MPTVLYLTYHGLASPLGRAQCLPYLLRLARAGRTKLLVVSWESDPLPDEALRREVRAAGIEWIELRYHGEPKALSKVYDLAAGIWASLRLMRRHRVDAVHARSYVLAALAWMLRRLTGTPYVFDMLGMLADEYADIGHWRRFGFFYRATKVVERSLLRDAATVIVLTDRSQEYLREARLVPAAVPIAVIPCCVDTTRFRCDAAGRRAGPRRLVYAGGLGGWYLVDETIAFFAVAMEASADLRLRIVTRSDPTMVERAAAKRGVPSSAIEVIAASPDDMTDLYCSSDVGLCFIAPMFSKHAASPNKFAEYLACGLPVVANRGVGDLDRTLDRDRIGVALDAFDDASYRRVWRDMLELLDRDEEGLRARCREVAEREFASERAVDAYDAIYRAIAPRPR